MSNHCISLIVMESVLRAKGVEWANVISVALEKELNDSQHPAEDIKKYIGTPTNNLILCRLSILLDCSLIYLFFIYRKYYR